MTIDEYASLEQDFLASDTDIKTFLRQKGISYNTYYCWKHKVRGLQDQSREQFHDINKDLLSTVMHEHVCN